MRIAIRGFRKWDRVPGVYDYRACPHCAALVYGTEGQQLHQAAHDLARQDDEWEDPGGYVIGNEGIPVGTQASEDDKK